MDTKLVTVAELELMKERRGALLEALKALIPWVGRAIADGAFADTAAPLAANQALAQAEAAIEAAGREVIVA